MSDILFSVVIPNLHCPVIDQTLRALELQEFDRKRFEVVVVGMDRHDLVHENDLIRFERSEQPLAPARARNRGAALTSGEVIVFIDADCIPKPDWLQVLSQRFAEPGVAVVGGGISFIALNYWSLVDNLSLLHESLPVHRAGTRGLVPTGNLSVRRGAFEKIGGFNERYPLPSGEDADLTLRLRQAGYTLNFEPRAEVIHNSPRHRFGELLRRSYRQGMYSTKMDPKYASVEGFPGVLRTRLGVLILSPFLATYATLKIFRNPTILKNYWHAAPAILISKFAWCFGAAHYPFSGQS
jgi:GT2 family glycosyltransferase